MEKFQEKFGAVLGPGGRYHPPNCQAHYKVAIIIPYRDREEHLQLFIQHMHPFLQRQQIDYGIFVVEQSGIQIDFLPPSNPVSMPPLSLQVTRHSTGPC